MAAEGRGHAKAAKAANLQVATFNFGRSFLLMPGGSSFGVDLSLGVALAIFPHKCSGLRAFGLLPRFVTVVLFWPSVLFGRLLGGRSVVGPLSCCARLFAFSFV